MTVPPERSAQLARELKEHHDMSGALADQRLIPLFYRTVHQQDMHVVATDSFIDKSKEQYNSAWLARELVQNFVDHNPTAPGTLDGVSITEEKIAKSAEMPTGGKRFIIEGNWPFKDITGVISPHSEKPAEQETAGGNGIGLKQSALRLLRDFGAKKFDIYGEGWIASYGLVKKGDINAELDEMTLPPDLAETKVKHDWLVAQQQKTDNKGKCRYVIETAEPQLITALSHLKELGVSKDNPFLKEPDLEADFEPKEQLGLKKTKNKQKLIIKWLKSRNQEGRLFVNGQVMNFKTQGDQADNYWRGPEGVTVAVQNVAYKMSIDRPPIHPHEMELFLINDLIGQLPPDTLIEQIRKSEHLWTKETKNRSPWDKDGFLSVVENIIEALKQAKEKRYILQEEFQEKRYLAYDSRLSDAQYKSLKDEGYTLCPECFKDIGMEGTSKKFKPEVGTEDLKPQEEQHREGMQQLSEISMQVYYDEIPHVSPDEFFRIIKSRLNKYHCLIKKGEQPHTFRVIIPINISKDLMCHPLARPKKDDEKQNVLHQVRSIIMHGLKNGIFTDAFTNQNDYLTTYAVARDRTIHDEALLIRNLPNPDGSDDFRLSLHLKPEYVEKFATIINAKEEEKSTIKPTEIPYYKSSPVEDFIISKSPKARFSRWVALLAVVGGIFGYSRMHSEPTEPPTKDNPSITAKDTSTPPPTNPLFTLRPNTKEGITPHTGFNPDQLGQKKPHISGTEPSQGFSENPFGDIERLVEEITKNRPQEKSAVDKYNEWLKSNNFYELVEQATPYIFLNRDFSSLKNRGQKTDVKAWETNPELDEIKNKLKTIADKIQGEENAINNFQIEENPTKEQLAKLGLLKIYFEATLGVKIPNNLFIIKGQGRLGINIHKKAIGIHEALLTGDFSKARETFAHELAHNISEKGHGDDFIQAEETIFGASLDAVEGFGRAPDKKRSNLAKMVLDIENRWDNYK